MLNVNEMGRGLAMLDRALKSCLAHFDVINGNDWGVSKPPGIMYPLLCFPWRQTHLFGEGQSLFTDDPGTGWRGRQFVDLGSSWRWPLHPALHLFIHGPRGWWAEQAGHLIERL